MTRRRRWRGHLVFALCLALLVLVLVELVIPI